MGFRVEAKIEGLDKFMAGLADLRKSMQKRVLYAAMRKATSIVNKSAKALAPVDTGALRQSLGVVMKAYQSGVVIGVVEPRSGYGKKLKDGTRQLTAYGKKLQTQARKPRYYAHLVEFGVRPHSIGSGSSIRSKKSIGGMHPGVRARPFLGPAFRANNGRIVEVFGDELDKALAKL